VAGFELPKGVRVFNWHPIPDDYRPKKLRLDPIEGDDTEHLTADESHPADACPRSMNAVTVDLRKLEEELGRRPLDEIAEALRTLTYGEMLELAASMWKVNPEGSSLTEHNLPAVLYRWSTSREL
jgi:hypothetical protein